MDRDRGGKGGLIYRSITIPWQDCPVTVVNLARCIHVLWERASPVVVVMILNNGGPGELGWPSNERNKNSTDDLFDDLN